jgi:N-acetylmuramoyl-L-alanine amidase
MCVSMARRSRFGSRPGRRWRRTSMALAAPLAGLLTAGGVLAGCATAGPVTGSPPPAATAPGPPSRAAATSDTVPAAVRTVVLDPGHNGGNADHPDQIGELVPDGRGGSKPCNTTGTSTDDGYPEHEFTWDLAGRVAADLRAQGVQVVMTRDDDTGVGPCVDRRAEIGNEAGADAVVSLHADGAADDGHGFHVAYSSPALSPSQGAPSQGLADAIVGAMVGQGFAPATYIGEQGLDPRPDLAGLNFSRVPAVLVECANMRHESDAATVADASGRERYAHAISAGVLAWLARQPS